LGDVNLKEPSHGKEEEGRKEEGRQEKAKITPPSNKKSSWHE